MLRARCFIFTSEEEKKNFGGGAKLISGFQDEQKGPQAGGIVRGLQIQARIGFERMERGMSSTLD
jgi:hypothetical protein